MKLSQSVCLGVGDEHLVRREILITSSIGVPGDVVREEGGISRGTVLNGITGTDNGTGMSIGATDNGEVGQ